MNLLAIILVATLSRAEIIDRMRASPITRQYGMVEVIANCPRDMREEFQSPIASFVSEICATLYRSRREQPKKFSSPAILVTLGEIKTNNTDVIIRRRTRDDGSRQTRLHLPAPGFTDLEKLRRETVKAFYYAIANEIIDDEVAIKRLRDADPVLRAAFSREEIAKWRDGKSIANDDEYYIRTSRAIFEPGVATRDDVLHFASRLAIYPEIFSSPFCGKYRECSFRDAIDLAKKDARIRFIAFAKAQEIALYGSGRSEELRDAAKAYCEFLIDLAAYKKSREELLAILATADQKLSAALTHAK